MHELRRLIGSPNALFTFEASARLVSFTLAAKELGVTQAAVSFSIKHLEQNLGVALFQRHHRRLELTIAGERLYQDVALGLGHIGRSTESLSRAVRSEHVTLSSSTAFASQWILPRLPSFRAVHPLVDFRIQTSDRDVDIVTEKLSLGIRRGIGDWPHYDARKLASEVLFPVCSPGYHQATGPVRDIADLASRKLIHLEEPHRPRPTWQDWFAHHHMKYRDDMSGLRLNEYSLVVQAAIGGQGIALGWTHIVAYALKQGLLIKPLDLQWDTGQSFFVVASKSGKLSSDAVIIRDWLLEEALTTPN
ncbi:MAG: LysR family transcriptional regulator [Fimbriimonadaceae bacterium]|nr:LysR family transcriptional regulator [Alphaproteobacteria bacterium]